MNNQRSVATQFTRFTGTKVQIPTPEELRAAILKSDDGAAILKSDEALSKQRSVATLRSWGRAEASQDSLRIIETERVCSLQRQERVRELALFRDLATLPASRGSSAFSTATLWSHRSVLEVSSSLTAREEANARGVRICTFALVKLALLVQTYKC